MNSSSDFTEAVLAGQHIEVFPIGNACQTFSNRFGNHFTL